MAVQRKFFKMQSTSGRIDLTKPYHILRPLVNYIFVQFIMIFFLFFVELFSEHEKDDYRNTVPVSPTRKTGGSDAGYKPIYIKSTTGSFSAYDKSSRPKNSLPHRSSNENPLPFKCKAIVSDPLF